MALFDAAPIIIELFPILIVLPMFLTMIGFKILVPRTPKQPYDVSRSLKPIKWLVLGPFVIIVLSFLASLIIVSIFRTSQTEDLFVFCFTLFQGAITIGIGCFAGIIILGSFETRGVSAFLLAASLLAIIPLFTIYTGTATAAIGYAIYGIDMLFLMLLFQTFCLNRFYKRLLGAIAPEEKAEAIILQRTGGEYIPVAAEKLNNRITQDGDMIAREALNRFQETEGDLGVYIKKVLEEGVSHTGSTDTTMSKSRSGIIDGFMRPNGSWTLTNDQFNRKVRINRVLYFIFLIPLVLLAYYSSNNLSLQENQWALLLSGCIIGFSILLAAFDKLFLSRRMNSEEVWKAAIGPLMGMDIGKLMTDITEGQPVKIRSDDIFPSADRYPTPLSTPKTVTLGQSEMHSEFLGRVNAKKDDVYTESYKPLYVVISGFLTVIPTGMTLFMFPFGGVNWYSWLLFGIFLIGLPLLIGGIVWWYKLMTSSSFYGIRRSILSTAISYLDVNESGVEDIGMIIHPRPPKQFVFFHMAGPNTVKYTLERLEKMMSIKQDPEIARKAKEAEMKMLRPVGNLILIATVVFSIIMFIPPFSTNALWSLFFLTWLLIVLVFLFGLGWNYLKARQLKAEPSTSLKPLVDSRVTSILDKVRDEYRYPLRLLMMQDHEHLFYSGRIYTTSKGVQLKEAVFLPH